MTQNSQVYFPLWPLFNSIDINIYCDINSKQVTLWRKKIDLFYNFKEFTITWLDKNCYYIWETNKKALHISEKPIHNKLEKMENE